MSKALKQPSAKISWHCVIAAPFGKIGVFTQNDAVSRIGFLANNAKLVAPSTAFCKKITSELKSYWRDPTFRFSLPLAPQGTTLQQQIWQALRHIPLGETTTYGNLAKQLNTSPRVIGNACRQNPIPLIIPCHRVLNATGLGGYAGKCEGKLIEIKQWLLNHEKSG